MNLIEAAQIVGEEELLRWARAENPYKAACSFHNEQMLRAKTQKEWLLVEAAEMIVDNFSAFKKLKLFVL